MEKNKIKQIFKYLELPGIAGNEEMILREFKKDIKKIGFDYVVDNLGSTYAVKKSKQKNAKKIMVDSHIDEVGFAVSEIDEKGIISFSDVGGFWPMTLLTNRVAVWSTKEKKYPGTILAPSPHLLKGDVWKQMPDLEKDMKIDIGLKNAQEAKELGIRVGSQITFDSESKVMLNNKIVGKSLDNRIGVFICLEILETLKDVELPYDLYIGASVQEEVGLRGARTAVKLIKPDFAFVVDVSPSADFGNLSGPGRLGNGTLIRYLDASTISNPKIIDWQRNLAKSNKIKTQNFFSLGGTNAGIIHVSNNGVLTAQNGLVARSIHSPSGVVDLSDVEETIKFMVLELKTINDEIIDSFKFS